MAIEDVLTDAAPRPAGPYSQARVMNGELVFCSGQIPTAPADGAIVGNDVASQTERVLANLEAVLDAAGSDLAHVLKTTVYLADMADFAAMNEVYARHFTDSRPARTTTAAAGLARGVRVEIDCIAARK